VASFTGYILISTPTGNPAPVTFFTASDDGSVLYVDELLVVNNDFLQGVTERSGTVTLDAGFHSLRLEYFQGSGPSGLQFLYSLNGGPKQPIPADLLYHVP